MKHKKRITQSDILAYIIIGGVALGAILLGYLNSNNKIAIKASIVNHRDTIISNQYYVSHATLYHPTIEECGWNKNIGTSGDTMKLGDCAVSQIMFDKHVNYYDTIEIINGSLKGKYCVKDKSGSKIKLIDVWKPVGDKLCASYKCLFVILRKNIPYGKTR